MNPFDWFKRDWEEAQRVFRQMWPKSKQNANEVAIELPANVLFLGMCRHFARAFGHTTAGFVKKGQVTFDHTDGLPPGVSVTRPVVFFWPHFGQKRFIKEKRVDLAIGVAGLQEMLYELEHWSDFSAFLKEMDEPAEGLDELLDLFLGSAAPDDTVRCDESFVAADLERIISRFEHLSGTNQARAIRILRWLFSFVSVYLAVTREVDKTPHAYDYNYKESTLRQFLKPRARRSLTEEQKDLAKLQMELPYLLRLWGSFYKIWDWEEEAYPGVPINEFLPKGVRELLGRAGEIVLPVPEGMEADGPQQPLDLGDEDDQEEIQPDDPLVQADRWPVYEALGCKKTVRPKDRPGRKSWFRRKCYVAHLLRTPKNKRVAALEGPGAAYLFLIDDSKAWAVQAQESKAVVRAKAGTEGHTFLIRICHREDWVQKLREWFYSN